jgi:Carboxypeptidase regulatory-like domain
MQQFKQSVCFLLVAGMVFSACLKDKLVGPSPTVETAFAGRVIDENGMAIVGAQVRAGGDAATTDENGVFRLKNLRLEANDAKVFITKIGYYPFSRAYYVENNSFQNITVQLLKKTQTAVVNAASGGTVEVPGGPRLLFPANAVVTTSGQPYSGAIRVFATYLDPMDPNLALNMPGDLRGIDQQGIERALVTYGMIGVELEGSGGQPLQVAPGSSVTLQMPVSPAQAANAPNRIPLWHFDVEDARWVEEGFVQKEGNMFVGQVSHFSFWNVDVPFNLVEISGKVYLNDDQHPYAGAKIRLTLQSDSSSAYATTDAMGCYKGGVPQGGTFTMEILDACGEVIFTQTIGPINESQMLPPVILTSSGPNQVSFSGTLLDCAGAPVTNGYVKVVIDNQSWTAFTDINGAFSIQDFRCDTATASGTATAFDLTNLLQSEVQMFSLPPDSVALGNIEVCDTLNEFIVYTLDNADIVMVDPTGGVLDSIGLYTFITAFNQQQTISMAFDNGNQTGTFPILNFWAGQINASQPPVGLTTTVTTVAVNVGDIMEGTFGGTFLDVFGIQHTVSGSYRVVRDY